MPTSKPTQTIVHRIELQKTERAFLEEYIQKRQEGQIISAIGQAAGPIGIGVALYFGARMAMSAWTGIEAALNGVKEDIHSALIKQKEILDDPAAYAKELAGVNADAKTRASREWFFSNNPDASEEEYQAYLAKYKAAQKYKRDALKQTIEDLLF